MLLDRWRARRAIATRNPPTPVNDGAHASVRSAVEELGRRLGTDQSLGDPSWHFRWDGELQLVGLDATERSVTDVRQRLLRLVHECDLRHLPRRARRVVAVVRCLPRDDEGLRGWHQRLEDDRGEVGPSDWRAARRRIAVLALDARSGATRPRAGRTGDAFELFGGDRQVREAVAAWAAGQATG